MEQIRAAYMDEQPVRGGDVAETLARIEAKLATTALACERMLATTEALVGSPTTSPSGPNMLTKKELARRFGISTRTVDRWRSMGFDLGEVAISGTIRFDPKKIAQIISTQKIRRRRK